MVVFISGVTSEIGSFICEKLLAKGHIIIGTYRNAVTTEFNEKICSRGGYLFKCDYLDKNMIDNVALQMKNTNLYWDVFISAVGIISPIAAFEDSPIDKWEENIYINSVSQLRLLHGLLPFRNNICSTVFFMTSKGINDSFPNHMPYCLSKIMLVKACELLDDEIDNCKFVAFNPGFIQTKIINQEYENSNNVLDNRMSYDEKKEAFNRIWKFMNWVIKCEKSVVSGRNYMIKFDNWEDKDFKSFLQSNDDTYKLRRSRDSWND